MKRAALVALCLPAAALIALWLWQWRGGMHQHPPRQGARL